MTVPDFTPAPASTGETPDFTPVSTVKFTLYGETFYGVPELTLDSSFHYETLSQQFADKDRTPEERIESMRMVIRTLLEPDSAERFIGGLTDRQKPIGIATTTRVFKYIMESYGERPTTPGSDSSAGSDSPESGTPSTASSSPAESTSSA